MKKFLFMFVLIPLMGISQTKTVLTTNRIFPKPEKVLDFEKALAAHVQKYHKGDWKWRVFEIQTGPDAGGYMVSEGPTDWATLDSRGNLGTEHNEDWNKSVAIYTTEKGGSAYASYIDSLSTVQLTDYSDKIIINHVFPKPGMINGVIELEKKLKKVWTAGNESVAVYQGVNSGSPELINVTRLKNGLKELSDGYRKPLPERFDAVHGAGSWQNYLADYAKNVESRWSEMLSLRADLSSK